MVKISKMLLSNVKAKHIEKGIVALMGQSCIFVYQIWISATLKLILTNLWLRYILIHF